MYSDILNLLSEFMFVSDNLDVDFYNNKFKNQPIAINNQRINNKSINNQSININNQPIRNVHNEIPTQQIRNDIFVIRQKDSLFWAFYIIKNGLFSYEMSVLSQSFSVEMQEKFKYIELIRKNKELLKLHKINKLTSLENELANEKTISIKTFMTMCIIENINVYLINDRKVYVNISDESLPINIIFKNKNKPNYCVDFETTEEKINNYKENYLIMNSFEDKLKSMNSYNMDELSNICKKLDLTISSDEKINKKYLYDLILKHY